MCTAASYKTKNFYFGRTLDYEFSYGDEIVVLPREYPLRFRHCGALDRHYAIIGMAYVAGSDPLFYDGINEKGLGMAGLNFVGNAHYFKPVQGFDNVAQFEFIPWILSRCATVREARGLLSRINLFDRQMLALSNYMSLSPKQPENRWGIPLETYSRGMGALGLPGDLSSQSRFVRVAYTKMNSKSGDSEEESVSQFFHILGSVDQQRGCCEVADGKYEITIYTSCCNASRGIYYYTTYDNHQICAVDMHRENLDGSELSRYALLKKERIFYQN